MNHQPTPGQLLYESLGTRRVVNCLGVYTDLGGTAIAPSVWEKMSIAGRESVYLPDLIESAGARAAHLLGAEAGWIVPGASAAIVLMTAAAMVGSDGSASQQLPSTDGVKRKIVVQAPQRPGYRYLRMAWMGGGEIVEAGTREAVSKEQLVEALKADAAALFIPAHLDAVAGAVPLVDAAKIARDLGIPTLVDAAYLNFPPESMGQYTAAGADLVCFSAKYFYGPNAGGCIVGRQDLIDAVAVSDFTRFESVDYWALGRPFKMDRYTVVGTIAALEEWFSLDHAERWASYRTLVDQIASSIRRLPGVTCRPRFLTMDEAIVDRDEVNSLEVVIDRAVAGRSAADVSAALKDGDPSVLVHPIDENRLLIAVDAMPADEVDFVTASLREQLWPGPLPAGLIRP